MPYFFWVILRWDLFVIYSKSSVRNSEDDKILLRQLSIFCKLKNHYYFFFFEQLRRWKVKKGAAFSSWFYLFKCHSRACHCWTNKDEIRGQRKFPMTFFFFFDPSTVVIILDLLTNPIFNFFEKDAIKLYAFMFQSYLTLFLINSLCKLNQTRHCRCKNKNNILSKYTSHVNKLMEIHNI